MTTIDTLLNLYATNDNNVMKIGWIANDLLNEMIDEEKRAGDRNPNIRPILTHLLDELCGEDGMLAQYYPNSAAARSSVSDRLRVMRFFTKDIVAELPGKFGFNHLRECYVGNESNWPYADEQATKQRLDWAVENKWPAPAVIRQQFGNTNNMGNLIEKYIAMTWRIYELPGLDPVLKSYCGGILDYHCGEDGKWKDGHKSMDDAKTLELLEAV